MDAFVIADLHNKATSYRNYAIDRLNELKDILMDERALVTVEMIDQSKGSIVFIAVTVIVTLISSVVILVLVSRMITRRLSQAVDFCKQLASGKLKGIDWTQKEEMKSVKSA